jgi:hypothetical protein
MSVVTNVIIVALDREDMSSKLTAALPKGAPFMMETRCAGDKELECDLWLAAFNHIDLADLKWAIETLPWDNPKVVQLFVKEEHDQTFREVGLWERSE